MTPSWYDLLGVDAGADTDEVRAAWKAAIAELDPGERRFRLCTTAAEVLLDPERRAAYDAELAADDDAELAADDAVAGSSEGADNIDEPTDDSTDEPDDGPVPVTLVKQESGSAEPDYAGPDYAERVTVAEPATGRRPGALVWVGGVLVALLLAFTVVVVVGHDGDAGATGAAPDTSGSDAKDSDSLGLPDDKAIAAARAVAEEAVVPVLSYDYRTLAQDQKEARAYLTPAYAEQYDQFFTSAVLTNAPRTRTVVRVRVLNSATVRTGPGRVDVLLFVNRPTVNKRTSEPVEYHDQVTMRMVQQDDTWLVGCMITQPGTPCPT